MADTKISALTALTGADVDTAADVLAIVDTGVTTTKKILIDELGLALQPFIDSEALIRGSADATKLVRFEVDGLTTGTTRVLTPGDQNSRIGIVLSTEQASTSGTSIDFTGIPAGVRRITIMWVNVSTNGSTGLRIQIGDAGGFETTGYLGSAGQGVTFANFTDGFGVLNTSADAARLHGSIILTLENSAAFTWTSMSTISASQAAVTYVGSGSKSLSAELTQVRITADGIDTFDNGVMNITYE